MTAIATERPPRDTWLTKVPVITATFWMIKVLSTTVGETFADFLAVDVGLGPLITDLTMFTVLAVALTLQFRRTRYTPWIYWLCVVLVSIVGTQITDFFTDTLGVSLYVSTPVFAVLLAVVFVVWYRQERTLAISSIDTPRREAFYWGAILVTFALGTAAGDLSTEALSLGFRNGALAFGALIALTYLAYRLGAGAVLTFWIVYVLTRPLGASLGDLLTQDTSFGGLGLGASLTSVVFLGVIVVLVVREQRLVNRYGVAEKGSGPSGGRRSDVRWAVGAAAAVAVLGLVLGLTRPAATTTAAAPDVSSTPSAGGTVVRPTTPLGDVSTFTPIVVGLQAKVARNDLAAATADVKSLELAWDDAQAGLKPRDPQSWKVLDGKVDAVLTALRASAPTQAESAAALDALKRTLDTFNGI